jgi:hypothetical protein
MQVPQTTQAENDRQGMGATAPARRFPSRRWLSEPLLQFLLAGALLFGAYRILNPEPDTGTDPQHIEITKDDLRQLAIAWLAQGRQMPTADQMRALVDQKIAEEILAREAIALGLDRNDQIIKRRLAQKMDFLAADLAAFREPTSAELETWFRQNSERFALPPRASFRHLYFSFDKRGKGARDAAALAIGQIAAKATGSADPGVEADRFMFQDFYGDRMPEQVAKEFGPQFAKSLFELTPGSWQGPIESGYGWHLVWVDSFVPGRVPAFAEVKSDVKSEWVDEQYRQIKRRAFEEMRGRYTITVPSLEAADLNNLQIPQGGASAPGPVSQ